MIQLFDHGYLELVEKWGSDERIIESARMSTDGGFRGWEKDMKLLRYLYENKHLTPFEQCGLTFEVQAPIFVAREWMRHRTQSYNELSARYSPLPDLFYLPSMERLMAAKQSQVNKQGSEEGFTPEQAASIRDDLSLTYQECRTTYESLLERGVAREIARLVIPVAQYSRWRASANLRNWLQFLELRLPENAQFCG
jgi:thymidylate synthase (FAD)